MKILVIQQKMIGDVLASSILCNNLKKNIPNCQVDYLIYPFTSAVVENNPNVDNIILFDEKYRKSKIQLLKFALSLRKNKYDIVIDAYSKLESKLIVLLSGANKRISYDKSFLDFMYNIKVKRIKVAKTNAGNALEDRINLLSPLLDISALDLKPKIFLTSNEIESAKTYLIQNDVNLESKIYMISILGSEQKKSYPANYMAKILDFIIQNSNAVLLFNYIPNQIDDVKKIYDLCQPETQQQIKLNITGKSLREFMALTHHCNALIGNEGGAINMAKALNIPTYTIFSTWINKASWNSFENGSTNISIHLKDVKPELYNGKSAKEMKNKAMDLYNHFVPEMIFPTLKKFLELN